MNPEMIPARTARVLLRVVPVALLGLAVAVGGGARAQETVLTTDLVDHLNPGWSPDGNWLAYERATSFGYHQVYKRESSTAPKPEIPLANAPGQDNRDPRWSPVAGSSGQYWIAYSTTSNPESQLRIAVVSEDGATIRIRSSDPDPARTHSFPRWSPDGVWITFAREQGFETASVYRCPSSIDLPSNIGSVLPPHIALIAAERFDAPTSGICKRDVATFYPVWSPYFSGNGYNFVAYLRENEINPPLPATRKLQIVDWLGGDLGGGVDLVTSGNVGDRPEWKPLGFGGLRKLVFSFSDPAFDPLTSIGTVTLGGTRATLTTGNSDQKPAWARGGCSRIVFVRKNLPAIWVVNEDGSGAISVASGGADYDNPQWDPSGQKIAYQKMINGIWQLAISQVPCP